MIVSFSNAMLCPKEQLSAVPGFVARAAACPVFNCRLSCVKVNMCYNNGKNFRLHIANGYSNGKVHSASVYEGAWEDPDDGTDDSEYEDDVDTDDENEDMEENDLDYESDWEAGGNEKAVVSSFDELSTRKYEEDLAKEVDQLLSPEERKILEQNEVPNMEKLSTAKWKPFHTFALAGQIKFMDEMLANGCDIDLVDKDGLTARHHAVIGKREAVISHLLRRGANPEAKDLDGATPLHYAAQVGAMQTVKLLIKYKVDVNTADNEGWTSLHVAMQTRNRDITKILLVNGADTTRRNKHMQVFCSGTLRSARNIPNGNTPLDLGLCYGKDFKSYELAKLLKQIEANRGL